MILDTIFSFYYFFFLVLADIDILKYLLTYIRKKNKQVVEIN